MIRWIRAEIEALRGLRLTDRGEWVLVVVVSIAGAAAFFTAVPIYLETAAILTGQTP